MLDYRDSPHRNSLNPSHSHSYKDSILSSPSGELDPPSPTAESMFYPLTNASAPSHTYIDPSFYGEYIPPVPKIPSQYRSASTQSLSTNRSGRRRELPIPPSLPSGSQRSSNHSWPRSRSTPPGTIDSAASPSSSRPSRQFSGSNVSRSNSLVSSTSGVSSRPLPQPPQQTANNHSRETLHTEKRGSRPPPRSLPPTPVGASSSSDANQYKHTTCSKETKELADWVRSLTSHHIAADIRSTRFDFPPPAYYDAINFSSKLSPPHQVP